MTPRKRRIYKIGEGILEDYEYGETTLTVFLEDENKGVQFNKKLIGRRIELLARVVREGKR